MARVLVAVPAFVVAVALVDVGGLAWAIAVSAPGCAALAELYRMLERWKTVPAAGNAALAGMCMAAHFGGERQVVEVALGSVPVLFAAVAARGHTEGATIAIAGTLLGIFWLGAGILSGRAAA